LRPGTNHPRVTLTARLTNKTTRQKTKQQTKQPAKNKTTNKTKTKNPPQKTKQPANLAICNLDHTTAPRLPYPPTTTTQHCYLLPLDGVNPCWLSLVSAATIIIVR
jgi:hypothetical protein